MLDYAGNELHCICFDRRFVTMDAYEDLLAVVYHSSLPMWGCQSLKMRIYKITPFSVTVDRDVILPIRPNSILKWFGFSEEGMIFCQDSLEMVIYSALGWNIVMRKEKNQRFYPVPCQERSEWSGPIFQSTFFLEMNPFTSRR